MRVDGQARCLKGSLCPAGAIILGITLMKIYWTLKSIPELSGLPSGERGRVWRAAHWKMMRHGHWQYWAGLVAFYLCLKIGEHIYDRIGGYIGVAVGSFIFSQVSIHLARPYIRALLSLEHVAHDRSGAAASGVVTESPAERALRFIVIGGMCVALVAAIFGASRPAERPWIDPLFDVAMHLG
jgi:hypothetical protein